METTLDSLAAQVDAHYIGNDASAVAARVRSVAAASDDADQLARSLTELLRNVTKDVHFAVIPRWLVADYVDRAEGEEVWLADRHHNGGVKRAEVLAGNVGMIEVAPILASPRWSARPLIAATQLLVSTDAIIVDVRNCGGGDPEAFAIFVSFFVGESAGAFHAIQWNDGTIDRFRPAAFFPGCRFDPSKPVFVLTSSRTASGAEAFIADLRLTDRATVVGETTVGAAHPVRFFAISDELIAAIPAGRATHPETGDNWEGRGLEPDVRTSAAESESVAVLLALEHVASTAPSSVVRGEAAVQAERLRAAASPT